MTLSIIIVNWNSTDDLRACLVAIYQHTKGVAVEVIVVDNASRDESCGTLIRDSFPQVLFHRSEINLGFARASNLGYELSSGNVLLFLNPDTEIHDDVFSRMINHLLSSTGVGAVGARLLNTDGSLQSSCVQAFPTIWNQLLDSEMLRRMMPKSRLWGMRTLFEGQVQPVEVDAVSGACLMVRRHVFAQVKQFDVSYFMYVEDIDLCHKITRAGYAIQYMADCEVVHHGGRSSVQQGAHFASLRQQEAVHRFLRTARGGCYAELYRSSLAVAALVRMVLIVVGAPILRFRHHATSSDFSLQKWSSIFRWAIGLRA